MPALPDLFSDPFGRCTPGRVSDLTRADRVALLGRAAQALLDGRMPDDAARLFLAGGLVSWLSQGGSLTKDFWRVAGPQGCTVTESRLWNQIASSGRATGEDDIAKMDSPSTEQRREI